MVARKVDWGAIFDPESFKIDAEIDANMVRNDGKMDLQSIQNH